MFDNYVGIIAVLMCTWTCRRLCRSQYRP